MNEREQRETKFNCGMPDDNLREVMQVTSVFVEDGKVMKELQDDECLYVPGIGNATNQFCIKQETPKSCWRACTAMVLRENYGHKSAAVKCYLESWQGEKSSMADLETEAKNVVLKYFNDGLMRLRYVELSEEEKSCIRKLQEDAQSDANIKAFQEVKEGKGFRPFIATLRDEPHYIAVLSFLAGRKGQHYFMVCEPYNGRTVLVKHDRLTNWLQRESEDAKYITVELEENVNGVWTNRSSQYDYMSFAKGFVKKVIAEGADLIGPISGEEFVGERLTEGGVGSESSSRKMGSRILDELLADDV